MEIARASVRIRIDR